MCHSISWANGIINIYLFHCERLHRYTRVTRFVGAYKSILFKKGK